MAVIQIESAITSKQLFEALEQLPQEELSRFVSKVLTLRSRRAGASLSMKESKLFARINRALPQADGQRYRQLIRKRDNRTLTETEHAELCQLSDRIEILEADRLGALMELARLRQVTLEQLRRKLGIQRPRHA